MCTGCDDCNCGCDDLVIPTGETGNGIDHVELSGTNLTIFYTDGTSETVGPVVGASDSIVANAANIYTSTSPTVNNFGTGFGSASVAVSWAREIVMGNLIHIEVYVDLTTGGNITGAVNSFRIALPSGVLTVFSSVKASHFICGNIQDPAGEYLDGLTVTGERRSGESTMTVRFADAFPLDEATRYIFRLSGLIYNE